MNSELQFCSTGDNRYLSTVIMIAQSSIRMECFHATYSVMVYRGISVTAI